MSKCGRVSFFIVWTFLCLAAWILLFWNVKWHILSWGWIVGAVFILIIICVLCIGVMESLTITIFTLAFGGKPKDEAKRDHSNLTVILNYNMLAMDTRDVDETYERMFDAFMDNLSDNVSAVYLSATKDPQLVQHEIKTRDKYRAMIEERLIEEGQGYAQKRYNDVSYTRMMGIWRKYEEQKGMGYINGNVHQIAKQFAKEFMCIHRVSRVLKKCGQYQDLMILSEGRFMSYTYSDPDLYGNHARSYGEPMFYDTEDVRNIHNRKFDYTLVLDGDSRVPSGVVTSLLGIAAAKPEKAILQPGIKFEAGIWDTIFMNLEDLRQRLGEPVTNALGKVFDQCGFFGKALIKNRLYIDEVIGTPDNLLEKVPVDVLSHDTYEAAILKPYYIGNVALVERPTYNYLAWNSRQRRWNLGDLIVGMYLFPRLLGAPLRALQKCAQGKKYFRVRVRTPIKLDFVTAYIAYSSLRSLFTKPLWLFLVLILGFLPLPMYYPLLPVIVVLVIIVVVAKLCLFLRCHKAILYIIPELLSSILQYTVELVVGFVRFFRVLYALIRGRYNWIPQRHIEDEFDTVNPCKMFIYSWKHLWGYAVFALLVLLLILLLIFFWGVLPLLLTVPWILIYFDLACIFLHPMYCFITSLRICPCCHRRRRKRKNASYGELDSLSSGSDHEAPIIPPEKKPLNSKFVKREGVIMDPTFEETLRSTSYTVAPHVVREERVLVEPASPVIREHRVVVEPPQQVIKPRTTQYIAPPPTVVREQYVMAPPNTQQILVPQTAHIAPPSTTTTIVRGQAPQTTQYIMDPPYSTVNRTKKEHNARFHISLEALAAANLQSQPPPPPPPPPTTTVVREEQLIDIEPTTVKEVRYVTSQPPKAHHTREVHTYVSDTSSGVGTLSTGLSSDDERLSTIRGRRTVDLLSTINEPVKREYIAMETLVPLEQTRVVRAASPVRTKKVVERSVPSSRPTSPVIFHEEIIVNDVRKSHETGSDIARMLNDIVVEEESRLVKPRDKSRERVEVTWEDESSGEEYEVTVYKKGPKKGRKKKIRSSSVKRTVASKVAKTIRTRGNSIKVKDVRNKDTKKLQDAIRGRRSEFSQSLAGLIENTRSEPEPSTTTEYKVQEWMTTSPVQREVIETRQPVQREVIIEKSPVRMKPPDPKPLYSITMKPSPASTTTTTTVESNKENETASEVSGVEIQRMINLDISPPKTVHQKQTYRTALDMSHQRRTAEIQESRSARYESRPYSRTVERYESSSHGQGSRSGLSGGRYESRSYRVEGGSRGQISGSKTTRYESRTSGLNERRSLATRRFSGKVNKRYGVKAVRANRMISANSLTTASSSSASSPSHSLRGVVGHYHRDS